ncbi:C2H2 type zinc-finger-domain-containing protein [Dactylonectria estremocensis]|uniref:C2H2 type zinc-finger-domain-containing protein n=1 Tax=Dactylonectria estremocensis TaxID=1079267 RepID=A0A9P9DRP1_9HYPO|nr:C2H2 type zinc-finger-domain-containing protein [Dactylonectria estremocensis]
MPHSTAAMAQTEDRDGFNPSFVNQCVRLFNHPSHWPKIASTSTPTQQTILLMTIPDQTSLNTQNTTNTANMTDTSVVTGQPPDQPGLAIAQAPTLCRLCDMELTGLQTWRAHVKSGAHVYKLRLKIAEPGSVTSPPPTPPSTDVDQTKSAAPRQRDVPDVEADQDQNVDNDTNDEPSAPEFVPGNCLFCAQDSGVLDDSMTHMATTHGFTVPFQDFLAVDLETVVAYLHFVISGYRECICCGTRRGTVEGVQQHMVAKGHCRFDVTPDTEEFYEMPQSENLVVEQANRDTGLPVRLPSGKLVAHRKNFDNHEPRPPRRAAPDRPLNPLASNSKPSSTPGNEVAHRRGANGSGEIVLSSEALLAAQLSRLRIAGDRIQQKAEARKRGRLESAQNAIMLQRFRLDAGDARIDRRL